MVGSDRGGLVGHRSGQPVLWVWLRDHRNRGGTTGYHGAMALILLVGYASLAIWNIRLPEGDVRAAPILRLLAIGIGVQFAGESVLLLSGYPPRRMATARG